MAYADACNWEAANSQSIYIDKAAKSNQCDLNELSTGTYYFPIK